LLETVFGAKDAAYCVGSSGRHCVCPLSSIVHSVRSHSMSAVPSKSWNLRCRSHAKLLL